MAQSDDQIVGEKLAILIEDIESARKLSAEIKFGQIELILCSLLGAIKSGELEELNKLATYATRYSREFLTRRKSNDNRNI